MFQIGCTIFNNFTYDENNRYRHTKNENVIYGSPLKIRDIYPPGIFIFIAEMNNETNKIEGIGLIKNLLVYDRRYKIYENDEYNRYIYRGKYWLNRNQIADIDSNVLEVFENILFKGKTHLKRKIGIVVITEQLFMHWDYDYFILKTKVKDVFLYYFQEEFAKYFGLKLKVKDEISETDKKELNENNRIEEDKTYEIITIVPKKKKKSTNKNTKISIVKI
jgi:hypothetical protein